MDRRRCQYCTAPLGRLAKLLHIYTCNDCAWRMSLGGSPRRPDAPSTSACRADCDEIPGYCASGFGCLGTAAPSTSEETAREALAHNIADVLENGPRLTWNRKTAPIAIDRPNKRVLETGLGALGVGTMWVDYEAELPEWADLPEQNSASEFGGPFKIQKISAYLPISADYLRMIEEDAREMAEAQARWDPMTPEEQAKATAEHEERLAREKAERTCPHCGCDPDEHGGC